jgi:hypothetical protein
MVLAMCVAGWNVEAEEFSLQPGQPIEFSEPGRSTLVTNLNQLGETSDVMRDFEEDSSRGQTLSRPQESLSGILPMPGTAGAVIVNKRGKDPLDMMNGSGFKRPEDAMRELVLKELLKLPGYEPEGRTKDQKQQAATSVGELYERILGGGAEAASASQYHTAFGLGKVAEDRRGSARVEESRSPWTENNVPSRNTGDSALDSRLSLSGPNTFSGLFGFDTGQRQNPMSPEALRAREVEANQRQRFQELLNGIYDIQPAATPAGSGAAASPWESPAHVPTASEQRNPFVIAPTGTASPELAAPRAPLAPVPSSLSPTPYTPPPRTPPPKPLFSAPQRVF